MAEHLNSPAPILTDEEVTSVEEKSMIIPEDNTATNNHSSTDIPGTGTATDSQVEAVPAISG